MPAGFEGNKVQLSIASRICLLESGEMVLRAEIRFLLFQPASYARCIPHNICAHCWVLHTLESSCHLGVHYGSWLGVGCSFAVS
jgi:hypothetical protein